MPPSVNPPAVVSGFVDDEVHVKPIEPLPVAVNMPRLVTPVPPPPVGAAEVHVVPFDVRTFPSVPGATPRTVLVPFPRITLFAVSDTAPVPP